MTSCGRARDGPVEHRGGVWLARAKGEPPSSRGKGLGGHLIFSPDMPSRELVMTGYNTLQSINPNGDLTMSDG